MENEDFNDRMESQAKRGVDLLTKQVGWLEKRIKEKDEQLIEYAANIRKECSLNFLLTIALSASFICAVLLACALISKSL